MAEQEESKTIDEVRVQLLLEEIGQLQANHSRITTELRLANMLQIQEVQEKAQALQEEVDHLREIVATVDAEPVDADITSLRKKA